MRETDLAEFGTMIDAVCSLLSRGSYTPNAANTALWFRALAAHDIDTVRAGFDAHVRDPQRGRFVPTPADVLAQIEGQAGSDGRPGPEEAWAMALGARDESETVVWTQEMAQAWAIARPVFELGDEVGARMAFREAYGRLVDEARRARVAAAWSVSLGFDTERRSLAIAAAVHAGRLPESEMLALPAPARWNVPLLAVTITPTGASAAQRQALQDLRAQLLAKPDDDGPGADGIAKAKTAQLQAQIAETVRQYQASHVGAA